MSHNNQKKIAAINDYSGFGRCSIAVELPIISALKVQCCPLPTSILSNHTGFESFYFEDFTESMPAYIKEWEKLNLKFDGICTGFLGSHKQIEIVRYFFDIFLWIIKIRKHVCCFGNAQHMVNSFSLRPAQIFQKFRDIILMVVG